MTDKDQEGREVNRDEEQSRTVGYVWVLASGPVWSKQNSLEWLPAPDKVVAADGGLGLAAHLGLMPDLIVGDMDSAAPSMVEEMQTSGVEVRRYSHDTKWETDTELAALAALEWQPTGIIILGGTGGRLDHTLANILLLTNPRLAPVDVRVIEGHQEVSLAKPNTWNDLRADVGDTVTLLPLGEDATGVRTQGLVYPLHGETLPRGFGRGVSNQVASSNAQVWLEHGQLLVVVSHLGS